MKKTAINVPMVLCILCCVDTIGIGTIIMQMLPRIGKLGASPFQSGLIAAIYGAVQLFSSPIMGKLGDKLNRRHLLIIIMLICSVNYYILGTTSLIVFIISRLISGLVKHTQLLSTACISDETSPEQTSTYFGYMGAGIGIGFIVGPLIGGFLAELPNGFSWMCTVASLLFLVNAVLVWTFLPNIESKKAKKDDTKPKPNSKGIRGFLENVGIEDCWDVLLLQGLVEFSVMIYFNNCALEMGNIYGLAPKFMGIFMAGTSVMGTLVALIAGKIEKYTGEKPVPYLIGALAISYFIISLPISFFLYTLMVLVMTVTSFLLRCWWPAMATSRSAPEKSGAVVGATHSEMAIAGMLAPIIAGMSTELFGNFRAPNYMALLVALSALVLCQWYPKPNQKLKAN